MKYEQRFATDAFRILKLPPFPSGRLQKAGFPICGSAMARAEEWSAVVLADSCAGRPGRAFGP